MTIKAEGTMMIGAKDTFDIGREGDVAFVAPVGPGLPLTPGGTYVWQLWIDDDTREEWRHPFYVRPLPQGT